MGDRRVSVTLDADITAYKRALAEAALGTAVFARSVDRTRGPLGNLENDSGRAGNEIDRLSGRLRLFADAAAILGPALAPIGAAAVGGFIALSAQLGATAGALGVTVLAVNGLGDGLKALNAYQLDPTAENLEKLNQEMEKLGPTGAHFVQFLDSIGPELKTLQFAARDGLLPGAEEGIENLLTMLPQVRDIISNIANTLGDLSADAGDALAGPEFSDFFDYLETDAVQILDDTARTVGNLVEALGNLFVAFAPLQGDFANALLEWSEGLAEASANMSSSEGFAEFVAYIEDTGPMVVQTLGALSNAILQIVEAAAPLGGPVLQALTGVANAIATIADSDAGPTIMATVTALALLSRSMRLFDAVSARPWVTAVKNADTLTGKLAAARPQIARSALAMGGLALATSGVADGFMLGNTATMALTGSLGGPWGAAIGGAIGLMLDLSASTGDWKLSTEGLVDSLDDQTGAITANTTAWAANELEKNGVLRDAADLGLNLDDVTQAALGNADAIERVTTALADQRAAMFDSSGALAVSTDTLMDFDDSAGMVEGAIAVMGGEVTSAQGKFTRLSEATAGTAKNMEKAATAADRMSDALSRLNKLLDRRAAVRDYKAALDDFTDALKDNGRAVDINTPKGRAMAEALDGIARQAGRVAETLKGADKLKFLTQARKDFVDAATKLYGSERAAKRLADKLFNLDAIRVEPKIGADTGPADRAMSSVQRGLKNVADIKTEPSISADASRALAAIRQVQAWLNGIPDEHVKVYIDRVGSMGGNDGMADGGTVPGKRMPYGDKMLAYLAPGEEVISNRRGQADRFRSDRAAGRIPRYADGGNAHGWAQGSSNMGVNGLSPALNGFHELKDALKKFKKQLEEATQAVDRERRQRDDLIAASKSFASAVGGAFAKADPFSGGLSDFDIGVQANANDSNAAKAALAAAANKGLDGPLYQALAASGNLQLLQEFAGLSAAQIAQKERQFASQSAAQAGLGAAAAEHAFAEAIKDQTKELKEAQKERQRYAALTKEVQRRLDQLPDKVERGARAGVADRDRRTSQRVAAAR